MKTNYENETDLMLESIAQTNSFIQKNTLYAHTEKHRERIKKLKEDSKRIYDIANENSEDLGFLMVLYKKICLNCICIINNIDRSIVENRNLKTKL